MNFALAAIVKWFHDELVALRKELGLATATATPVPPEVVQHVQAAQAAPIPATHPAAQDQANATAAYLASGRPDAAQILDARVQAQPVESGDRSGFTFGGVGNVKVNQLEAGKEYVFTAPFQSSVFKLFRVPGGDGFSAEVSGTASHSGPVIAEMVANCKPDNPGVFHVTVSPTANYGCQVN